eukprot:9474304-Pyramimonas_sp.AAC.1
MGRQSRKEEAGRKQEEGGRGRNLLFEPLVGDGSPNQGRPPRCVRLHTEGPTGQRVTGGERHGALRNCPVVASAPLVARR